MAHFYFYGTLKGNRREVSRCGTANSGLRGHLRGWELGVEIHLNKTEAGDTATVYLTSGSNGAKPSRLLGRFTVEDLQK